MDNTKDLITINIKNTIGENVYDMSVQVTQQELDLMEEMRQSDSAKWEGKDLELLKEVKKRIKETVIHSENQCQNDTVEPPQVHKTKENKGTKTILWWVLGAILFIIIVFRIVTYTMTQSAMKKLSNVIENTKISYQGISFEYGYGWEFEKEEIADGIYYISGANGIGFEYGIIIMPDTGIPAEDFITNIVSNYQHEFEDVQRESIYKTKYNKISAKAMDYSLKVEGEKLYAKTIAIINNNHAIIINLMAPTKKQLSSYDFRLIENTFSINK